MLSVRLACLALLAAAAAQPVAAQAITVDKKLILPAGQTNTSPALAPGILVGNTLYLSGQLGTAGRDSGVVGETRAAIRSAQAILQAAGMSLSDVVSITVYLADINDFQAFNGAYREFFTTDPRPTRTTVAVAGLVNQAKIELTMTAVKTK